MIVDLFAGPGGWSEAVTALDLDEIGLELDATACATRAAAGHPTIRTDVAAYPAERFAGADGLIASPPCQAFSRAGKRKGHDDATRLREHLITSRRGWVEPGGDWSDPRAPLVLEPLRWALAIRPPWIVLEQVPPVIKLWSTYTVALADLGYRAWAGVLDAADYGVPQHRERAVLIAILDTDRPPTPPPATHGPGRTPYVTMGAALGWHDGNRELWEPKRHDQSKAGEVNPDWPLTRPATTLATRSTVADPGANANRFNGAAKSRNDGYHVDVEEALTLQSFPADYPIAGAPSKAFEQIGNAVAPRFGAAILDHVVTMLDTTRNDSIRSST